MIGELGHFALILAFVVAVIQGVVPLLGAWRRVPAWMGVGVSAARAQFLLIGISYLCRARVLAVMALISVGFHLFLLLTSNPFERLLPPPLEGRDLNPLLQDPGMAGHPPLLYMGYVGLVVPFSFAVAALVGGRIDLAWTRTTGDAWQ